MPNLWGSKESEIMHLKKGETYRNFCKRLQLEVQALNRSINLLKSLNIQDNVTNPKTSRLYKQDAEVLFEALIILEENIRLNKTFIQDTVQKTGFNLAELYEGKLSRSGAYNV